MPLKLYLHLELKNNIINADYFRIIKRYDSIFFKVVSFFLLNEKGKCMEKGTEKKVMEGRYCYIFGKGKPFKREHVRKLFSLLKLYTKK
ncbi:hypothetical protein CVT91_07300 [Candidatus Atribacteria bacterium HGW-Atribacteria-1]|nr:MAG: hypothetical protein CVT91_07300 [Candidatus Atribacteria bacterium HGW-Atribacteria-1]